MNNNRKARKSRRAVAAIHVSLAMCLAASITSVSARNRDGGSTSAEMLRLGDGARGAGMGQAYTSHVTGPDALRYNSAGLSWMDNQSLSLTYNKIFLGSNFGSVNWARPLSRDRGIAVGVKWIDYGRIKRTTVANQTGSGSALFSASDVAVSFGYAMRLADIWSVGVTARYFSSEIDVFEASTLSADFGIQWRGSDRWTAGLSLQNVGSPLKYQAVEDDLPFLVKAGVTYELKKNRWFAAFDVEKTEEEEASFHVGTEYKINEIFSLRAGFDGNNRAGPGLTTGMGFVKDRVSLDYAFSPFGDLGSTHHLTVTYDFGPNYTEPAGEFDRRRRSKEAVSRESAESRPNAIAASSSSSSSSSALTSDHARPDDQGVFTPRETDARPKTAVRDLESADRMMLSAQGYFEKKEYGKALLFYESALSIDPENFRAQYNIAAIHYIKNDYESAASAFTKALKLNSQDISANLFLALCHQNLGNTDKAIVGFERVVAMNPGHPVATQRLRHIRQTADNLRK